MNAITRSLIASAALTIGGLTLGAGAASADVVPFGPSNIAQPQPGPVGPQGPGDIAQPQPGPVDPQGPNGPGTITNPEPGPDVNPDIPQGPGGITAPQPCPTHGGCGDPLDGPDDFTNGDGGSGGDEPTDTPDSSGTDSSSTDSASTSTGTQGSRVATPTRVDAGLGPVGGTSSLEWLLLGGSLVGLSGAAYGARRLMGA